MLITNGNASLSGSDYNALSWAAVPNALGYKVYRRTQNLESLLATVTGTSFNDTGTDAPAASNNLLTLTSAVTPSFIGGVTTGWTPAILRAEPLREIKQPART